MFKVPTVDQQKMESRENRNLLYFRAVINVVQKELAQFFIKEWNSRYKHKYGEWDDTLKSGKIFCKLESKMLKLDKEQKLEYKNGDTNKWECTTLLNAILLSKSIGKHLDTKTKDAFHALHCETKKYAQWYKSECSDDDFDEIFMVEKFKDENVSAKEKVKNLRSLVSPRLKFWQNWFIIVDNVVQLSEISSLLPQVGDHMWKNGQLIITVQNTDAVPYDELSSKHISISSGMNDRECCQLLNSYTKDENADDQLLNEVSHALDRQPLALATTGPNHIDVAVSLNNLGLFYDKTGKHDKAIEFFQESLEVRKLNVPEITRGDDANAKGVGNSPGVENKEQEEWKYIDESSKHRELLLKLIEYGRNSNVGVEVLGNVRVIFTEEFCIGDGSNATRVFLGLGKDGYGKAVKRIHRHKFIQLAHHEKKILNEFNAKKSKYVVNYFYLDEDTGTEYVYLMLDLCEESLESFVKSSTLHDLQKALPDILRQILKGLADLHSGPNPILHRDLKPSNVLRDSKSKFLIADFGISRIMKNDTTTYKSDTSMGTLHWLAPESYRGDVDSEKKATYQRRSDVYNAGMVAYYVATKGNHPFGIERHRLDNMLNGNPVGLDEIKDETLKDLLSWMLNLKPKDRPYSNEALKHPFLMSDDEKFKLLSKVGNLQQIKSNDPQSSVVRQLNSESVHWKSQMGSNVYEYFVNGRTYKSLWTECLRLIRNIDQHWNDRPRPLPQPEPFYKIGDYRAYFLRTFPNLPVRVHAAVRSNEELKNEPELKNFFYFNESELHQ
ncbi:serine/threonine-protein kinase/endoribonuclease IRE1b-like [Xenia sp. Carnegie-2017]|uniref:serine/threonine-protein kinase/endoribonuclease IRE1b-like n=1 Tax=Xenia sp. Carnegie-2017 TaxID=2897299 RepID=UPI001F044644|nr:serine/threonine-protein kinase/endoribonuclease IRE1b-like [Xenia sp. Carnegie-2017]